MNSNSTVDAEGNSGLLRGIRIWGVAVISLNSMIGAGIFALPAAVAVGAGILSPWMFLLVGVLFTSIVLVFAELSTYFNGSGGPAEYTRETFGPLVGFGTGWLLFISRMIAAAANTNVMVIYIGKMVPWFAQGVGRVLLITVLIMGLTWINVRGVKDGIRTLGIFTFFKVTPLLLMVLLGLPYVTGDLLLPLDLPRIEDFDGISLLIIYAYVGFEAASFTAGETKNAQSTLPKALIRTLLFTAVLYFLIMLVFIAVLPEANADSTLVDVGYKLAGPMGGLAITIAAIFSIGGNLASNILSVPRISYAMSEKKLLPRWFGHVHPRYLTPDNSLWFLGVLVLLFALSGTFVWLAAASSLARLIAYFLCAAAVPVIRRKNKNNIDKSAFRLPLGYTIPVIALTLCVWMAMQANQQSWLTVLFLCFIGLVLYWYESKQNR